MSKAQRSVRSMFVSLAAAAGAALALGAAAQSASAVTLQSASGSPGWIAARTWAMAQDTSDVFTAATQQNAAIGVESMSLYASPASSQTQLVTVTEHVWAHWLNGWIDEGSSTRSYYVAPGAWRTVVGNISGGPAFGWFGTNGKYLYVPQLTVTWKTTSGAYLGQKIVNYDAASDQHCLTVGCTVSNDGYSFPVTFLGQ